jgi:hypothetical protein
MGCSCLKEGIICAVCIAAAATNTYLANRDPNCPDPRLVAQRYCQNMPADLVHGPHEDHAPSSTVRNITIVAVSTAPATLTPVEVHHRA